MGIISIIEKKRDGLALDTSEIYEFVSGVTSGELPDYQISALLMAICINGMNYDETADLTMAMAYSGEMMKPSRNGELILDKHSTGGIGDKTTLIVGPVLASLGCYTAKMSGRGLGITGGTVDKLESIPGFKSTLSEQEFLDVLYKAGFVDGAQTRDFAPADKILYSLRDVTGTVESIPLIASSIMSKKLAAGADAIVLDVKCGEGAFMKDIDSAELLAETMIEIGEKAGRKCTAVISDMNSPLGDSVGNTLEIIEVVRFLKNINRDERLLELVITLCTEMYMLSDKYDQNKNSKSDVEDIIKKVLDTEMPYESFRRFVELQGGDVEYLEKLADESFVDELYKDELSLDIFSDKDGVVEIINAEKMGEASLYLGAGRLTLNQEIDSLAGLMIYVNPGDRVRKGDKIASLYTKDKYALKEYSEIVKEAYVIVENDETPDSSIIKKIIN